MTGGISAVVLSAGISSRMGEPKALVPLNGGPLLGLVLKGLAGSQVSETIVVLGFGADRIRQSVPLDGARVVENPQYASGMSSSLRVGVHELSADADAFFVVLGDAPFVRSTTYDRLIEARQRTGSRVAVPTFEGVRGNPVLLARSLAPEVDSIEGDRGCRAIHLRYPNETVEVPVDDPGVLIDIDTPEDVALVRQALQDNRSLKTVARELRRPSREGGDRAHAPRPRVAGRPDPLTIVADLLREQEPFALAIVVQTDGPRSRNLGLKAIVRSNGAVVGRLGDGCTPEALATVALQIMQHGEPRLVNFGADGAVRNPSESEPARSASSSPTEAGMTVYLEPHAPPPRLLIIGDTPVAECLASLGRLLAYRVAVGGIDLEPGNFPDADEMLGDLEQLKTKADASTFAVVTTMASYASSAVRSLAESSAAYVGLVASRRRANLLLEQLRSEGVPEASLARVRNPAGLDIGAKTPEEIALSVLAEITQVRRSAESAGSRE